MTLFNQGGAPDFNYGPEPLDEYRATLACLQRAVGANESVAADSVDGRVFAAELTPLPGYGARRDDDLLRLVIRETTSTDEFGGQVSYHLTLHHILPNGQEGEPSEWSIYATDFSTLGEEDPGIGEEWRTILDDADQFGWFRLDLATEIVTLDGLDFDQDQAVLDELDFEPLEPRKVVVDGMRVYRVTRNPKDQ